MSLCYLEHSSGGQQLADGDLRDADLAGVHEVDEPRHRRGAHALQPYARHLALFQTAREHRL